MSIDIDVFDERHSERAEAVAWLTGLLVGATGMVPGYMATAWAPNAEEVQELLDASAGSGGARRVLISTGALQAVMPPALSIGDPTGLTFDATASRGLLAGSALVPALGLKIRTVSLKARRRKPIGVARRLLDRMFGADRG